MTNREKFAEEILDIACSRDRIAVSSETREPTRCSEFHCGDCMFYKACTEEAVKDWANAEYIEQPKISKKDRDFLEYISNTFKYVIRDRDGNMYVYEYKPKKGEAFWRRGGNTIGLSVFDVKLPMVRWSDEEPWSIEDLKKLEVIEEYENN